MATKLIALVLAVLALAAMSGCASSGSKRLQPTLQRQQLAEQAYAGGNLPQALADYRQLTRDMPSHADFWFRLGNVLVRLQQPDQAVDAYQHVLHIEPDHAKAWHNLGIIRLRQAEAAFAQGAHYAAGIDSSLQQSSAQMVRELAALGNESTPAATSHATVSDAADAEHIP